MTLRSIDPATGEEIRSYEEHDDDMIVRVAEEAEGAQREWRSRSFEARAEALRAAAAILDGRADEWAELMASEMGKPLAQGCSEAEKCAWACRYYAEHAESFLAPRDVEADKPVSYVAFRPLGVLLAIMPWNFPFWQVFRAAAPALMAGNAVLLKHASNVTGCGLAIESILHEAGVPESIFRTVLVGSDRVDAILDLRQVRAATLTGSVAAGKAVGGKAGSLVKKTVLELGGSDAYVIFEDADLDRAAEICVESRLLNSGQSCIAAKRFVVPRAVLEGFTERMVEGMRAVRMGHPKEEGTEVGPLARSDLRDDLHEQVRKSVAGGAEVLLGGEVPERPGAFYPPTVLGDVRPGTPAYEEELFGPVAAIIPVGDETEAIRVANDSRFGLGAAVFTRDVERGLRVATEELEAGCCVVNDLVRSDPRLPFGGIKESGYGRELSVAGIREFVNVKAVYRG